jgi:hypothetical protein
MEEAAKQIRATGYPDADELVEDLSADDPSLADRASAFFEAAGTEGG